MPKQLEPLKGKDGETFGERMARLRKAVGLTQAALGKEAGISQRMVAYYEGQSQHPPSGLLPELADALGVTMEVLLGLKPVSTKRPPIDAPLWRRFRQLARLPPLERRRIVRVLDSLLEAEQLKQRAS